jgi:nicotinamide mononucleotide transporter
MDALLAPLTVFPWLVTSWLEILATIFTVACVIMANFRNKLLYPVGIVGTILFFFVFWNAKLYASAGLQVYFTVIQLYGWWFWYRGAKGAEPLIGNWDWKTVGLWLIPSIIVTVAVSMILGSLTDAKVAFWDTAILALSVLAQFLLDRKQLKSWVIWGSVNVIAIWVYSQQGLWLTTITYAVLLVNAFIGWKMWKDALGLQPPSVRPSRVHQQRGDEGHYEKGTFI